MMTAAEYRDLAVNARDRAAALSDPGMMSLLLDHARRWEQLANDADLQEALAIKLALMPSATPR